MHSRGFHISYLFKPSGALLVCLLIICAAVAIGVCAEMVEIAFDSSMVIAIVTGLIASSVVAALLQMGENYKSNVERSNELFEFFIGLKFYEHLIAGRTKSERRRRKDGNVQHEPQGKLNMVWRELDGIIPILEKCKDDRQRFLTLSELQAVNKISNSYTELKRTIRVVVVMKKDRSSMPEFRPNASLGETAERLRKIEEINHMEGLVVEDAAKSPDTAYRTLGILVEDTMTENKLSDSERDIAVCASYEIAEYLRTIYQEFLALIDLLSKDALLRQYGEYADRQYLEYRQKQKTEESDD